MRIMAGRSGKGAYVLLALLGIMSIGLQNTIQNWAKSRSQRATAIKDSTGRGNAALQRGDLQTAIQEFSAAIQLRTPQEKEIYVR